MDKRFLQSNKEARWSVFLTVAYLCSWIMTAYLAGEEMGITGMPLWFELSCLYLPLIFILLCVLMVKFIFKQMSLEDKDAN
ncbi:YhdT family protein [Arsenophonus sp.]|uniref:YhdT family protein n=1 Tax=Arsenophonus sp. TaxID=1872640 RepID=UPI00387A4B8D